MPEKIKGSEAKRSLAESLAKQKLVLGNNDIARKLADMVRVEEFPIGKQLYVQDERGHKVLFLILTGSINLLDNGEHVATLEQNEFVGEFPILDRFVKYTVSVFAREAIVVASLSEQQFRSIASEFPEIWQNMAKELATRLRRNTAKQPLGASGAHEQGDLTFGDVVKGCFRLGIWRVLTVVGFIVSALTSIAAFAYKLGAIHWPN